LPEAPKDSSMRTVKFGVLGATTVLVVACVFSIGGLADGRDWGDVGHYQTFGARVMDGGEPYHDFSMEYPPGALPAFVLPSAITNGSEVGAYRFRFKLLMTVCGLATLLVSAAILRRLQASGLRAAVALAAVAVAPAALGHVFLNRYDPWPALLLVSSLLPILMLRAGAAGGLLGAAFAAKLFAPIALPLTAIRLWRTSGRRALVRAAAGFALISLAAFGYFVLTAFGGLGFSLKTQLQRHLQTESLGASLLLAADRLGIYHAHTIAGNPGSIDLAGRIADAVADVSTIAAVGAALTVALAYWRRDDDPERFVIAFAATVAGFTAFAKVLSPQYLVWLVPLVPLVRGRRGVLASALFLGCLVLTQVENYGFTGLRVAPWAVWTILIQNLGLVALYGLPTTRHSHVHKAVRLRERRDQGPRKPLVLDLQPGFVLIYTRNDLR
jgi:hypothetical protein